MKLELKGHNFRYECEKICRIFFPAEKIAFAENGEEIPDESRNVYTEIEKNGEEYRFSCKAVIDGKENAYSFVSDLSVDDADEEKELAKAIVKVLSDITGITPPWGILTGVRPSKLMRTYISLFGDERAQELFKSQLLVSEEKTALAYTVAKVEERAVSLSKENSFSLYVSIPFCPTRCSYCSFVSHSISQAKKLIPDYVKLLCNEIKETAKLAGDLELKLETVYIGGGTPTSLEHTDLEKICTALRESFDMSNITEFTVEAGRPDTITEEKLRVLKEAGVTRISINPQTFSDEVLKSIGRKHTAQDIYDKFSLARALGFDNINTDLIAGLSGDTPGSFSDSVDKAISLGAENITVHTLALKSASDLVTKEKISPEADTERMVRYASKALSEAGYIPYYMYRQSKSVGNLENVGWCKENYDCLYNIYMMEEIHSVFAVGAGAVTRLKDQTTGKISRVYNFKYPYEYISRFDELIGRKKDILEFYGGTNG